MNDDPMDIFMCVKLGRFYDLVRHRTIKAEILVKPGPTLFHSLEVTGM